MAVTGPDDIVYQGTGWRWVNPYLGSPASQRVPYRCPVCEGRGNVPHGFYDRLTGATSTEPEKCRVCHGTGIIWSRDS